MSEGRFGLKAWLIAGGAGLLVLALVALMVWRGDILEAWLDPKVPYQTYTPPKAPDYTSAKAWALPVGDANAGRDLPADVFFVHPTTYDGGHDWNGPIEQAQANQTLTRVMLPNYAGPFARVGRVFAPRYRQASLYTFLTLREDARDARAFAYGDVLRAFQAFLKRTDGARPIVLVGVEQGGVLITRLVRDVVARNPALMQRLAGVYLIDVAVPAEPFGPNSPVPPCAGRRQARCVVGYKTAWVDGEGAEKRILARSLVWDSQDALVNLGDRQALCVNPVLGARSDALAAKHLNLGAANATGVEWGARPALLPHEVTAQCVAGLLRVSHPGSPSLRPSGSWADRKKEPDYNLFYGDLEADAKARVATLMGRDDFPVMAAPIEKVVTIKPAPIHRAR